SRFRVPSFVFSESYFCMGVSLYCAPRLCFASNERQHDRRLSCSRRDHRLFAARCRSLRSGCRSSRRRVPVPTTDIATFVGAIDFRAPLALFTAPVALSALAVALFRYRVALFRRARAQPAATIAIVSLARSFLLSVVSRIETRLSIFSNQPSL